jgi:hypothetical protein
MTAWVCPWGICNHTQAQECRAEMRPKNGCGGRFPAGTTLERAKQMIHADQITRPRATTAEAPKERE